LSNRGQVTANELIEQQLDQCAKNLERTLTTDILALMGDIVGGVDGFIRNVVEEKKHKSKREKLTVVLTTTGGYIEVVQRIVETLRHHYKVVDFIVPDYALSAGTVLVMSGDAIYMDYYSCLGPIDPQIQSASERSVSALGYIKQWERLLQKAEDGTITLAEVQLMIDGFDQAELYYYDQARQLSVSLLEEWLAKYKFKNWTVTQTRKLPVTEEMRKQRAKEIAESLNDTDKWHMHSRGISMNELQNDLKLLIDDFGKDPNLSDQVKRYHSLLDDYRTKMQHAGIIHMVGIYNPYVMGGEQQ
jgi:hypothetical protein